MASFITLFVVFLVVGILASAGGMTLFAIFLRKLQAPLHIKRALFIIVGSLITTPLLSPAGTLGVLPIPLGLMLAFTRSASDLIFLVSFWWFSVPSLAVTATTHWYISRLVFPSHSFKVDGFAAA